MNRLYPSNNIKKIRRTFQNVLDMKSDISIPTAIQNKV